MLTEGKAFSAGKDDRRIWVEIDWDKAPVGKSTGTVTIKGTRSDKCGAMALVKATAIKVQVTMKRTGAGGGGRFRRTRRPNLHCGARCYRKFSCRRCALGGQSQITDGFPSAMEVFPVTAATIVPPNPAPHLEYSVYFAQVREV